ncbi:putative sulfate exporter family transporter [bacterium]|nr:putative sulfate exporter family transporter [bacterium]
MITTTAPAPPLKSNPAPGLLLALVLAAASYWLATFPGLKVVGALTVALLIGILWRATAGLPAVAVPGTKFTAKTVLRAGIVLMGARLDFGVVAQAGPKVLFLDVVMIALGIAGIFWITKRFGVERKLGLLIAVGTSICGASAVAAASSVAKADEDQTTLAVALMGLLGTAGVLLYVFTGRFFGLTDHQLAILSGSTLHEVAQVMAAAFTWGTEAGDMGTLVKLTRVVLLAPALVVVGLALDGGGRLRYTWKEPPIPWFVIGFLAMGLAATLGFFPGALKGWLSTASIFLMVMAMAAMGLNTPLGMIRKAGMKVIYAGLAGFGLLAVTSYALIRLLDIH